MQPWEICDFCVQNMVSVPGVVALPWARLPSSLEKLCVHTAMCFGQYSYAMPMSLSMIDAARGVIGKMGGVLIILLMIAG